MHTVWRRHRDKWHAYTMSWSVWVGGVGYTDGSFCCFGCSLWYMLCWRCNAIVIHTQHQKFICPPWVWGQKCDSNEWTLNWKPERADSLAVSTHKSMLTYDFWLYLGAIGVSIALLFVMVWHVSFQHRAPWSIHALTYLTAYFSISHCPAPS